VKVVFINGADNQAKRLTIASQEERIGVTRE
jgi:hypothetical protein